MTRRRPKPDDLYRRNPALDVEEFAARSVALWVGDRGTVTDLSGGGGPDFRIDYHDGRIAFGEVGWHQDPELQAMWSEVFKHPRPQRIDLPSGLGQWGMGLVRGAHIKSLYAEVPDFVASLVAQGEFQLRVQDDWPRGEPADTARRWASNIWPGPAKMSRQRCCFRSGHRPDLCLLTRMS